MHSVRICPVKMEMMKSLRPNAVMVPAGPANNGHTCCRRGTAPVTSLSVTEDCEYTTGPNRNVTVGHTYLYKVLVRKILKEYSKSRKAAWYSPLRKLCFMHKLTQNVHRKSPRVFLDRTPCAITNGNAQVRICEVIVHNDQFTITYCE